MELLDEIHSKWKLFYEQFDTSFLILDDLDRPEDLKLIPGSKTEAKYEAEKEAKDMNFLGWIILELKFGKANQADAKRWADESSDPLASVVRKCLSKNPPSVESLLKHESYFQDIGGVAGRGWAKLGPDPPLTLNPIDLHIRLVISLLFPFFCSEY